MAVVQEIDTPGHSGSMIHARPEHIACYAASPWSTFAAGTCFLAIRMLFLEKLNLFALTIRAAIRPAAPRYTFHQKLYSFAVQLDRKAVSVQSREHWWRRA